MIPRVRVKDDGDVRLAGEADCPESDDEQTFQDAETCDACWRFFFDVFDEDEAFWRRQESLKSCGEAFRTASIPTKQ